MAQRNHKHGSGNFMERIFTAYQKFMHQQYILAICTLQRIQWLSISRVICVLTFRSMLQYKCCLLISAKQTFLISPRGSIKWLYKQIQSRRVSQIQRHLYKMTDMRMHGCTSIGFYINIPKLLQTISLAKNICRSHLYPKSKAEKLFF